MSFPLARATWSALMLLVQHYSEYSGNEVNLTAFRLIGMKPLNNGYWFKLDAKVPFDWENDTIPGWATTAPMIGAWALGYDLFISGFGWGAPSWNRWRFSPGRCSADSLQGPTD